MKNFGSIYVLEFDHGVTKVGKGKIGRDRVARHRGDAEAYGRTITREWISHPHDGYESVEDSVLEFCAAHWERVSTKREMFKDANFNAIKNKVDRCIDQKMFSYYCNHISDLAFLIRVGDLLAYRILPRLLEAEVISEAHVKKWLLSEWAPPIR